jgi:hypothetical protein
MSKIRTTVNASTAEEYKNLLDNIPVGRQQAISMKLLADSCGLDIAGIKAYVLQARIDGCFIISGQNGYYLPETLDELQSYFQQRRTVIRTASKAIRHFGAELQRLNHNGGSC